MLEKFERYKIVYTDKTFRNRTLQLCMVFCPVAKQCCSALCVVKCGLVSDWVTRANPRFFIHEMLNFEAATANHVSHYLSFQRVRTFDFSANFAEKSNYTSLGGMFGSPLQSKPPMFHRVPCKYLAQQTAWFVRFYFFGGRIEEP